MQFLVAYIYALLSSFYFALNTLNTICKADFINTTFLSSHLLEMDSANEKKGGFITRMLVCITNKLGKLKDNVVNIAKQAKKIGKDDPRKIIHAAKVGLALTLVSLFYYFKPLYDGFGQAGMWAVLTVVVVFEFSVGGTLSKCLNRGCATLLAGALGVGAEYLAELTGKTGEPIMLGFFVFILATGSTFARFFPYLKRRYDYGILIFILTFSLVTVSGYRVDEILELAHQRLSTIVIGSATCMIISMFICPVWAGQDLHNLVASNIEKVASFLEGFGDEYFLPPGDEINTSKEGKSLLQAYKSILGSKASEEILANAAWWEPAHGRFRFRHPWKQYLKVGALTRQCAYHIETLVSGYINSNKQAPTEFQRIIQEPCTKMSLESGKLLRELSSAIKNMTHPTSSVVEAHLHNMKSAIDDLKNVLQTPNQANNKSNLLEIIPILAVGSILIDIIHSVEKVSEAVHELSNLGRFKKAKKQKSTTTFAPEKSTKINKTQLHKGIVQPVNENADVDVDHVVIEIGDTSTEMIQENNNNGNNDNKKRGQQEVEV